jgi:hypothetical protein
MFGTSGVIAPLPLSFPFGMLQLRSLALLLAAIVGGVSAAIGPGADLPIVNRNIAPDGFLRL